MRIFPYLLAGSFIFVASAVALGTSLTGCNGGTLDACGTPYTFNLQNDSFHCGSCDKSCQTLEIRDQICQDGQCAKAACGVNGGCTGDAGACCGTTCCAFPDFCCATSAGLKCISGAGESQCPP